MRVSGLLLVLMVLTHFAIMHLYYGVTHIDFSVVAMRYATPFWRIYDLVLVLLAVTHGMNGAKMIIDDYITSEKLAHGGALRGLGGRFHISGDGRVHDPDFRRQVKEN